MPRLGAGPHRLAHLPGAQRAGIGQHLHHVPVGHRQPAPIAILAEDGNLRSHSRSRDAGLGIDHDRIPAGQLLAGQHLDHGLGGDLQPPQQLLLGGHLLSQPVHLGPQRLHPSAGCRLPRL